MTWVHLPNSAYSQDTGDSPSASDSQELSPEPSVTSSGTSTHRGSSPKGSPMEASTTPQFGMISSPLTDDLGTASWISSLVASRANHTPQLESVLEEKIAATSGLTPLGSYGKWNPATSSWRMSEDWLTGLNRTLRKSLGVFPRQGTTQRGVCVPLPKQAHPTSENAGGALPTPCANKHTSNVANMEDLVNSDGTPWTPGKKPHNRKTGKQVTTTLHDLVRWMTPNVMDSLKPKSQEALDHEHSTARQGRKNPNNLRDQVEVVEGRKLWRTPDAYPRGGPQDPDKRKAGGHSVNLQDQAGGTLNSDWVSWLMGLPIGWVSLEPLTSTEILGWDTEPDIPRVATDIKNRVSQLKALGNGIVPATVAEFLNS